MPLRVVLKYFNAAAEQLIWGSSTDRMARDGSDAGGDPTGITDAGREGRRGETDFFGARAYNELSTGVLYVGTP